MAAPINFESASSKEVERQQVREAREILLEKAQAEYEKKERKKKQAKERGEDTWMLSSVNDRIIKDQQLLQKTKKQKKDKKKKQKKEKKKKKKKSKKTAKEDDESSSDSSDSEDEPTWVEKGVQPAAEVQKEPVAVQGPKLQRDDWMSAPPGLFGGVTRKELRERANNMNKEKEEMDEVKRLMDQPGQHERELNPFWKEGGTGLPEEDPSVKQRITFAPGISAGDGGLSWWQKKYDRCVEQAAEEGRTLEEVATDRYGSLKYLTSMLKEAKKNHKEKRIQERDTEYESRNRDRTDSEENRNRRHRDRSSRDSRSRSRSPNRTKSRDYHRGSDRDRYSSSHDSRDRDSYRPYQKYEHSYDRWKSERDRNDKGNKSSRFMKPSDSESSNVRSSSSKNRNNDYVPRWKKKEFMKPSESGKASSPGRSDKDRSRSDREWERGRERDGTSRKRRSSPSPSEDSSSSISSSASDSEAEPEAREPSPPPVVLLTEEQMNKLGAKILKAEIMGNEEEANRLKAELDAARKARESAPAAALAQAEAAGKEEVVLTRTDRAGNVRPVEAQRHPTEQGRRRGKKDKAATHDKEGQRERYFADDDKYSLKNLVEREKLGTAEDQNSMFSRLAGKSATKTDDDFTMDDMFVSKANQKQSESVEEARQRSQAIFEHKKISQAMENCCHCFDKVSKHLIIAIGVKVYLCLPNHKSMTEGHCLIVPMQHASSATAIDDDVWEEIKEFRTCLTRLYESRDEDVVFMETSTRLKQHPHMVLECVPMPRETGDLAPIYFKKAILDAGEMWAQNKKLVDLKGRDVRKAIPKGFPYFTVDFGMQSGFAHVIEDEMTFPSYFGREIVGGMLDLSPELWRKPKKERFDDQRHKVLQFAEMWKPFDWTQRLTQND